MSRTTAAMVGALLVAATFAVYAPVRHHEFVNYDDYVYIVENPRLQLGLSADAALQAFAEPYERNWIPLTWLSFQLDHALYGLEPAGYLLTNVALHALSAMLLFLALARMTGSPGRSAFVAAVFALHPLHVESVAWASERKDALSGVFWMSGLWCWARYAERPGVARYLPVAGSLALGLLAKPTLVTFPFVLLLLDAWPLGRLRRDRGPWPPEPGRLRRMLLEKLPLMALAAAAATVTYAVQSSRGAVAGSAALAAGARIANALESYAVYLGQSFWPSGLAAFYPHPLANVSVGGALLAGAALAALGFAALRLARRCPYLLVGWLWYLGTLLPVVGLVQVGMQARADRYMYLPLVGLAIAVTWGVSDLVAPRRRGRPLLAALGALALLALGLAARGQVHHWRDTYALFERALAVTHDNYMAHDGLAVAHLRAGNLDQAQRHYEEARRLHPAWTSPHVGLADVLAARGQPAAAIPHYLEGLRRDPRRARTHANLGKALADSGRVGEAIGHYRLALELGDDTGMASIHALLADALTRSGDTGLAETHYQVALTLAPDLAEAHANLGALLMRSGRPDAGRSHLERAVALRPEAPELHMALGELASGDGEPRRALHHYREAWRLAPDSVEAANNLAWLLATHSDPALRNPEEALRIALEARALLPEPLPAVLDTLAAAYAAAGRYDSAVRVADEAIALATEPGIARQIESRRAHYAARQAYVEAPRGAAAP